MTQILTGSGVHEVWDRGDYREEIITGKDKNGTGGFCKISWKKKFSMMNDRDEQDNNHTNSSK